MCLHLWQWSIVQEPWMHGCNLHKSRLGGSGNFLRFDRLIGVFVPCAWVHSAAAHGPCDGIYDNQCIWSMDAETLYHFSFVRLCLSWLDSGIGVVGRDCVELLPGYRLSTLSSRREKVLVNKVNSYWKSGRNKARKRVWFYYVIKYCVISTSLCCAKKLTPSDQVYFKKFLIILWTLWIKRLCQTNILTPSIHTQPANTS